jgi:hypothetical protein
MKPKTIRIPVKIRVYDADCNEHEFGPIMVEINDQTESSEDHWELLENEEQEAKKVLMADLVCRKDFDEPKETNDHE